MKDSRRLERFHLQIAATVRIVSESEKHDGEVIDLLTSDVCSGGAYFHTEQPLPEGTNVKVDLALPIDELKKRKRRNALVKIKGEVIRSETAGMAICFEDNYKIRPLN